MGTKKPGFQENRASLLEHFAQGLAALILTGRSAVVPAHATFGGPQGILLGLAGKVVERHEGEKLSN